MTARRVLVFGATGHLGRHAAAAFTAVGDTVTGVSRAPRPNRDHAWSTLDLETAGARELAALLTRHDPEIVVNAAGVVWQADERRMHELNDRFAQNLTAALTAPPAPRRLIHLGSIHEYGPVPPGTDIAEDCEPNPVGVYGTTKLRGSVHVLEAAADGLDAIVLRVSNVCGPGTPPQSLAGKVIAHLEQQAALGTAGPLRLAPRRAQRDFVDVRDVACAVLAAADAQLSASTGRVVNVAAGRAVPVRALVDRIIALSGQQVRIVEAAAPGGAARSDAEWQQVDIRLARSLLGWKPERSLDESLRDALAAARAQKTTDHSEELR